LCSYPNLMCREGPDRRPEHAAPQCTLPKCLNQIFRWCAAAKLLSLRILHEEPREVRLHESDSSARTFRYAGVRSSVHLWCVPRKRFAVQPLCSVSYVVLSGPARCNCLSFTRAAGWSSYQEGVRTYLWAEWTLRVLQPSSNRGVHFQSPLEDTKAHQRFSSTKEVLEKCPAAAGQPQRAVGDPASGGWGRGFSCDLTIRLAPSFFAVSSLGGQRVRDCKEGHDNALKQAKPTQPATINPRQVAALTYHPGCPSSSNTLTPCRNNGRFSSCPVFQDHRPTLRGGSQHQVVPPRYAMPVGPLFQRDVHGLIHCVVHSEGCTRCRGRQSQVRGFVSQHLCDTVG
jgi:hypothetical protein